MFYVKIDTKLQKSNLRSQPESNHKITKTFFFQTSFECSLSDSCNSRYPENPDIPG